MEHCPRLLAAALKGGCVDTCIILSHLAASLSPCLQGPGEGGKVLGWRPCAVMALIRMGIMPVIGGVIVIGSNKMGLWHPLNPVFTFVLLLQWSVPTANQMQNLASMHNNNEQAMGTLIFWQYVAACLALPVWMTLYLYLMDVFDLLS